MRALEDVFYGRKFREQRVGVKHHLGPLGYDLEGQGEVLLILAVFGIIQF